MAIEHRLAHHAQKQGRFARYLGLRKNLLDSRRHAAILNLEVLHARQGRLITVDSNRSAL